MQRGINGTQEDATRGQTKLSRYYYHHLCFSAKIILLIKSKSIRRVGNLAPLGRHRHMWENDIKMDLKDIERFIEKQIYLVQERANALTNH